MNLKRPWACTLLLGAAAVTAPAQSAGDNSQSTPPVRIYVTATRGQKPATDVPPSAFTVFENGKNQPVLKAERFDGPVSWSLLIDSSASVKPVAQQIREIEEALLDAMPQEDEVSVYHFNFEVLLDARLTRDRDQIRRAFKLIDPRGGSAVRSATLEAIRYLSSSAANERKIIVLISDGTDNSSGAVPEDVVEAAQISGVTLYSLTLDQKDNLQTRSGGRQLEGVVKPTGGVNLHSSSAAKLREAAVSIPREVHSQYVLTYAPPAGTSPGTLRKVEVKVLGAKGVKVRAASGYYPAAVGTQPR
jgi:Ca-activated chloride channel family protein